MIHPTAEIHPEATIAKDIEIGPYCKVEKGAILKKGVILEAHVHIESLVCIEKNSHLYPFVHVGNGIIPITIGKNCHIREFTVIGVNSQESKPIIISNQCYIMAYCNIKSGVILEDKCTITNHVILNKNTHCQNNVIIGAKAIVADGCIIGKGSMIGGVSYVVHDIPPYCLIEGYPKARIRGLNLIGMRRNFENRNSISEVKKVYIKLKKENFSSHTASNILSDIKDIHAQEFTSFILNHKIHDI